MDDTQSSKLQPRLRLHPCVMPTCHFSTLSRCWHALFPVCLFTTLLLFHLLPWGRGLAAVAYGQTDPPHRPSAVRCPSPANPHKLYRECAGQPLDFLEQTLTADFAGVRSALQRLGITPTASYTAQFMGNPSGGQAQGVTYAGTLQTAVFWDLDKLVDLPSLAFNVSGAWSTGTNLSAAYIENIFTSQSAYTAPENGTNNLTLGELYAQQHLLHNALVVTAGRLAPQGTFATMPVLNQYISGGI